MQWIMSPFAKKSLITLLVLPVLLVGNGTVGAAGGVTRSGRAVHPRFQPVFVGQWRWGRCRIGGDSADFASGDFVLFWCSGHLMLVDDRNGQRVAVRNLSSCPFGAPIVFGAPWILFGSCLGGGERVYNLETHLWKRVDCGKSPCAGPAGTMEISDSIGSQWLEREEQWPGPCGTDYHNTCGPIVPVFVNLRTGRVRRGQPKSPTTILDLSSPNLVRHLCAPLRVPAQTRVTLDGRIAIFSGPAGMYVQRCGSAQRVSVPAGPMLANARVLVWRLEDQHLTWHGRIGGLLLPSLHRFATRVPSRLISGAPWILGSTKLYLSDPKGTLWATPFP